MGAELTELGLSKETQIWLQAAVEERVAFNRLLGVQLETMRSDQVRVCIAMRDDLVGNFTLRTLYGGVISSVLDATGGLIVSVRLMERMAGESQEAQMRRFARIGTIDLRLDYLRPGRGDQFFASATMLRTGNKLAVTRIKLTDTESELVAVGTGTYSVG